jgi:molybdopterin-containing oxidoreductase family iron-sulfur binding subunit
MNRRKDLSPELRAIQERLGAAPPPLPSPPRGEGKGGGKAYWRSLEELADTPAFQELMRREFPDQALEREGGLTRRRFLALMGASLALAGLNGCSVRPAPQREIVPYVRAPEEIVPGKPLFFATAMALGGAATGLLVESHMGRPTKVEGNPDHPASRGATDLYAQASVLGLYDPDRSQTPTYLGRTRTWDEAFSALGTELSKPALRQGEGVRLLTGAVTSPTLARQLREFLRKNPKAQWHRYEPVGPDGALAGTRREPVWREAARYGAKLAFGEYVDTHYDFTKANVVLSLDADFLSCGPGHLRYVADFMSRRRGGTAGDAAMPAMNRLYVAETAVTGTGAKADHRLALRAQDIEGLARAVAAQVGLEVEAGPGAPDHDRWVSAVAKDLGRHPGRCVVLAGERQPAAVHLLANALNDHLGNVGKTVFHTAPVEALEGAHSLEELVNDMAGRKAKVKLLVILGGNPVFTAPANFRFRERMQNVPLRVHLGLYQDETARQCHWHLPEAHYLEAWSDVRAYDGTASVVQPLIAPLYSGRSAHELLAVLTSGRQTPGYETVRGYWRDFWERQKKKSGTFETFWQTAVHDGFVPDTKFPTRSVSLKAGWEKHPATGGRGHGGLEIVFQPDPTLYDGRFANNGWLQELPKPLTRICWDNVALMSPKTARDQGVGERATNTSGGPHGATSTEVVELRFHGRLVRAPVWVMPGHADGSVTVYLGHGRTSAGKVGDGVGFNAYALRRSDFPWFGSGLDVRPTGDTHLVACTQHHQLMENRELVRSATLGHYRKHPKFAAEPEERQEREHAETTRRPLDMYQGERPYQTETQRWGMAIDLTACTGCSACVVACQAENNIPVVGKEEVTRAREMHWLRIDTYHHGGGRDREVPTEFYFQPVPCMQCEDAPCEYVCPVAATVHSADGLNDMVYNRCVGTRFCSNNCPYKVRRFNFFQYADYATESLKLMRNPDVTVRSRGVMEKCTYCVQRIRQAVIEAEKEERPVRDGEILTACQAACPARAIVFGDTSEKGSAVARLKESPLNYALLAELNTRPRTTYLAALRNPNPELEV